MLGVLRDVDLERLICSKHCRERDLVVAMVVQCLIGPGSKLSATRRFSKTTVACELGLGEVKEAELLAAMDWLLEHQERIEKALAKRHPAGEGLMLYDLSSSYVEGRKCPLASLAHSRDGKRGTAQVNCRPCLFARGTQSRSTFTTDRGRTRQRCRAQLRLSVSALGSRTSCSSVIAG